MLKLAVFGDPVAHSRSPRIHAEFARQCQIDVDYQAIHVTAAQLPQALHDFAQAGGHGLNLTVPHKTAVIPHCARLSERAHAAGAVNTLLRVQNEWHGDNTDGAGLVWDLRNTLGWPLAGRDLVIVGAGGAAAGVLPALLAEPWRSVTVANRTLEKAHEWARPYAGTVRVCSLEELQLPQGAVVINATSCGHRGICPTLPLQAGGCLAYDLNYGPAARPFLDWAKAAGADMTADGLGMLVGQAAQAFTIWTGRHPDAAAVLAKLRAEFSTA